MLVTNHLQEGRGAYVWWKDENPNAVRSIHMPAEPAAYARELYSVLHELDREGLEFIVVEPVPSSDDWAAIRDRLRRAGGHF